MFLYRFTHTVACTISIYGIAIDFLVNQPIVAVLMVSVVKMEIEMQILVVVVVSVIGINDVYGYLFSKIKCD